MCICQESRLKGNFVFSDQYYWYSLGPWINNDTLETSEFGKSSENI